MMTIPNPNRYRGRAGVEPDLLVLHYTAGHGNAEAAAKFMARGSNSAHYTVGRDGDIVRCVDEADAAWHAGDGRCPTSDQLAAGTPVPVLSVPKVAGFTNRRSVGIEICNRGWASSKASRVRVAGRHRNPRARSTSWEAYPAPQVEAVIAIAKVAIVRVPTLRYVCGHEDLTHYATTGSGSKQDPGPAWPWAAFLSEVPLQRIVFDFTTNAWVVSA